MKEQVIINGNLVNYYKFNENKEKNIVFLHGWRSNALAWNQVIEFFKKENMGIYALDLPGFGDSAIPKKAFSVGDYAETVAELIKKKNLKNVILVGHSVGGRIAIKLAATQPELINKLVLVDSAGFVIEDTKKRVYKNIAKIVKPIFKPKAMQGLKNKIYKSIGAEDYVATPELKETFLSVVNEDLSPCLEKITSPTLIIWGRRDLETPLSFGERMHQKILNSKLEVIDNAGHFSFVDKPEEFNCLLQEFIGINNESV